MDFKQTKPLRFVTNYGAPHRKRRRIGAACLTCRKRKTACSGERPYCATCEQNKLDCAGYASESAPDPVVPKKRQQDEVVKSTIDPALRTATPLLASAGNGFSPNTTADSAAEQPRSLFSGPRNRMPYFRWLGPTAIMPGFKQMVVKIKRQDTADATTSSADGVALVSPPLYKGSAPRAPFTSTPVDDVGIPPSLPFYDTSPVPPSELITHLVQTFFTYLGCNFPFLQRDRFLKDLEEKQVDTILVDAVCALAARFSTHALLVSQQSSDNAEPDPAEYGHAFAQRAKLALTDTFACPTVAAVQSALLLAYNEFGESRDSGLWVYLGISIRMAQDLGMHTIEGLRYKGMVGLTPRMLKMQGGHGGGGGGSSRSSTERSPAITDEEAEEQKAVEQERIDTFWAIFFLDRVVSSGTGRRSTLRDKDIELSFPLSEEADGWPTPFPALIRIVHLYGRVADLLNGIKGQHDLTTETSKRLGNMESQVTHLYQGLSTKLHFDAVNFQHYVKAGEGTNFVLLHFWFHTLIVLLHQPTLLKTFEGRMLQLFPNSQQLSINSAKTIADILSYSQLIDAKACLGNPFTTQPIYIAACAFLRETAEHTASNVQSRATSPGADAATPRNRAIAKHTLLATAATQHYQLCYKALQSLEGYWSGTKYILTVLDQKFEGVDNPLLYTIEEGESAMERPKLDPSFKTPGWRRTQSFGEADRINFNARFWDGLPADPKRGSLKAIGWTLTGNLDSPSTNLAFHYRGGVREQAPDSRTFAPTSSEVDDASLLLQLHTPYGQSPVGTQAYRDQYQTAFDVGTTDANGLPFGGMTIEQQDIDTSMLGLDMMPWFDATYTNGDMTGLYDGSLDQAPQNDNLPP